MVQALHKLLVTSEAVATLPITTIQPFTQLSVIQYLQLPVQYCFLYFYVHVYPSYNTTIPNICITLLFLTFV